MQNIEKYYDRISSCISFDCCVAKLRGEHVEPCLLVTPKCEECKKRNKEWLFSEQPPRLTPGMYIRYDAKNELGKVKRVCEDGHSVFAWFHTGDTASRIDASQFSIVMTDEEARGTTERMVRAMLHDRGFSNDYAIEGIVEMKEETFDELISRS